MGFDTGVNSVWSSNQDEDQERPGRLSQSGHMAGWAAFGGLVLVGFFFGIVTGYETPKPAAKAPRQVVKADPTVPPPGAVPEPQPEPRPQPKLIEKVDPPKVDPSKVDPPKVDPPKIENPPPKKEPPKTPVFAAVSFQKDVLPIFRTYCINCHGGSGKPKGNVDLRTIASIMKGGGGPIIEVGNPGKSAIYSTVFDNTMPPEGKRPGKGEIDVIRDWILGGAKP